MEYFQHTSTIFGLELAAVVLALFKFRYKLRDQAITVYIDNTAALAALINGDSSASAAFPSIAILWFISASHNIALWCERVDTHRNIADFPTRGEKLPIPVRETTNFPRFEEEIAYYTKYIAEIAPHTGELTLGDSPYLCQKAKEE